MPWLPINKIKIGVSLDVVATSEAHLRTLVQNFAVDKYMVSLPAAGDGCNVALHSDSRPYDQCKVLRFGF